MFAGCAYSIYIAIQYIFIFSDILVAFEHIKFVWFIQAIVMVHLRFCPRSKGHTLSDSGKLTPKSIVSTIFAAEHDLFWIISDLRGTSGLVRHIQISSITNPRQAGDRHTFSLSPKAVFFRRTFDEPENAMSGKLVQSIILNFQREADGMLKWLGSKGPEINFTFQLLSPWSKFHLFCMNSLFVSGPHSGLHRLSCRVWLHRTFGNDLEP